MKKLLYYTILATLTFAPGLALAEQPTIDQLLAQIAALQAQVRQLQQSQQPPQPTTLPSRPATAAIAEQGQNVPSFNRDLYFGMRGEDVRDLQEFLTDQGYYAGPITGNYGLLTVQGVKKFQQANGITPASGYFGSKTRALANEIFRKLVGQICGEEGCESDVLPQAKLSITPTSDLNGTVGDYFVASFVVRGGSGNYTIDYDGKLPPGLFLNGTYCPPNADCAQGINPDTVTLYGTPTKRGVYSLELFARDNNGASYGKERFTIVIKDKISSGRQPVISGVKGPTVLKVGEEGVWSIEAQDPSNGALVYRVVWGDEVYRAEVQGAPTPQRAMPFRQTATFAHTYYNAGVYSPTFYVINDRGSEARTSISVNVGEKPIPPVLQSQSINFRVVNDNTYGNYADVALAIRDFNGRPVAPLVAPGYAPYFVLSPGLYNAVIDAREYSDNGRLREQVTVNAQFKAEGNTYNIDGNTVRVVTNGRREESGLSGLFVNAFVGGVGVKVTGSQGNKSFDADFTLNDANGNIVSTANSSIAPPYKLPIGRYTAHISVRENNRSVSDSATFLVEANAAGYIIKEISQPTIPIQSQPSITVTSPNGGEVLKTGEVYAIRWSSINIPSSENVKIELGYNHTDLSYAGGTYNEDWVVEKTPNSGSYLWKVPEAYGLGMKESAFTVKISAVSGITDYSDGNFTIKLGASNPTLNVSSPVAGAAYTGNQIVAIKWSPIDAGDSFRFTLLRKGDTSFSRRVDAYYDNNLQSWAWRVPTGLSDNDYFLRVETHRNGFPYGIGYSGTFSTVGTAVQPSITVTSPNGVEAISPWSLMNVLWTSSVDQRYQYDLVLVPQAGTPRDNNFSDLLGGYYMGGISPASYNSSSRSSDWGIPASWGIPTRQPGTYKVRIYSSRYPSQGGYRFVSPSVYSAIDESDAPFSITAATTTATTTPASGGGGGGGGGDGAMNTGGNQNLAALLSAMQASLDKIKEAAEKLR